MTLALHIPQFVFNEKNSDEDIRHLLQLIKKDWDLTSNIKIKKVEGGFSCLMYHCFNDDISDDGLIVRVANLSAKQPFYFPMSPSEVDVIQYASNLNLFPKIFAVFKNGYCYKYVNGEPLLNAVKPRSDNPFNDDMLRLISDYLVKIHSMKIPNSDFSKSDYLKNLKTVLDFHYPDDPSLGFPSKKTMQSALHFLTEQVNKMQNRFVLCHGDSHPGNMLWNKIDRKLTIIDWECAHIGYQAFDIGYFLQSLRFPQILDPESPSFADKELDRKFVKFYLESWQKANETENFDLDVEFDSFYKQVKIFKLLWLVILEIMIGVFFDFDTWLQLPIKTKELCNILYKTYENLKDSV